MLIRPSRTFVYVLAFLLSCFTAATASAQRSGGWQYDPDAGAVYKNGDFRWTIWAFTERYWGPRDDAVSADAWRRVRQGMEFDLPRLNGYLRPAVVYEVDLTDNNFFHSGRSSQVFENLYLSIQNPDDANRFRALFGENTHILSREDNLSSGNLPTINRSLILEEHGSVNSFGTQWGLEFFKSLSSRTSIAFAAQDNRGSLNQAHPNYRIGNSLSAKVTTLALRDTVARRQLNLGVGADHTRAIYDRQFTLSSAVGTEVIGGTSATGNKFTIEGDAAYAWFMGVHPMTLEGEYLFSDFSHSLTDVSGGYALLQGSLFDSPERGDLDPFIRYDVVRLSREIAGGLAFQQAWRAGVNYNLPSTAKHMNLHLEYALNRVAGPAAIVPARRSFGEFRVELRVNAARYLRH